MKRLLPIIAICIILLPEAARAQGDHAGRWEHARLAWDAGAYVDALEGMIGLLNVPGGDAYLERIALLTGEFYRVTELAPDGRAVRFSPDGKYAAFETGPRNTPVTHILDLSRGAGEVATIPSRMLAFHPSRPAVAFEYVTETDQIRDARARLMDASNRRDRAAMIELRGVLAELEAASSSIMERNLVGGDDRVLGMRGLTATELEYAVDGSVLYALGRDPDAPAMMRIFELSDSRDRPRILLSGVARLAGLEAVAGGRFLVVTSGRTGRDGGILLLPVAGGESKTFSGVNPVVSADGSTLAWLGSEGEAATIMIASIDGPGEPRTVVRSSERISSPAISPGGSRVAYQVMEGGNWEIYLAASGGSEPVRLTREIQHDLYPTFLSETTLLAVMGEGRHRRSYLYDTTTLRRTRLFHNNTVRTVAPEYEWVPGRDGTKILIVSERDGDTVSPERAVYLVDLSQQVTRAEVVRRLEVELEKERSLRARGEAMFRPIADLVRDATGRVSITRVFEYQKRLFDFDSKHITRPGNRPAGEYIFDTFRSFGYEPEYQWFETRSRGGSEPIRTANVIATLTGTENPELIYVLSSHYDSSARGPGADDNSSGVAILLEAARVLADHPMPATIVFAAFTGEEAGLLGSREYVRRAVERGDKMVGALNNDMIGWSNDHRLDNTIRYSNAGIRDVQHAAAFLFSDLITYDALYYKSTDAAAYYEAYGDIVGGIGSYPILGNPYYHQPGDVLETMNHELVTESTRATVGTLMLLASSPARLTGLEVTVRRGDVAEIVWTPGPEGSVTDYEVVYGPASDPTRHSLRVQQPRAELSGVGSGTVVAVRAWNGNGLHGWDWAYLTIER